MSLDHVYGMARRAVQESLSGLRARKIIAEIRNNTV